MRPAQAIGAILILCSRLSFGQARMGLTAYLPRNHVDALAMGFTFISIPTSYLHGVLYIAPTIWPTNDPNLPEGIAEENMVPYYCCILFMTFLFLNTYTNLILTVTVDTTCRCVPLPVVSQPGWYFCPYCRYYAPPRAHHCPTCQHCVLRRDHHCFFAGKCIGFYNHRFFIAFLIYLTISAIVGVVTSIVAITRLSGGFTLTFIPALILPVLAWLFQIMPVSPIVMLETSLALFVTLGAGGLLILQIYMISRGQTYHEFQKNSRGYGKTAMENVADVMGKNWWFCWFLPFIPSPRTGDGAHYPPKDQLGGKGVGGGPGGNQAGVEFSSHTGKRKSVRST